MSVGWLGNQTEITIGYTDMQFYTDIYGPQWMKFKVPLLFLQLDFLGIIHIIIILFCEKKYIRKTLLLHVCGGIFNDFGGLLLHPLHGRKILYRQ